MNENDEIPDDHVDEETPQVHSAVEKGDQKRVRELAFAGVDLNQKFKGRRPVDIAIKKGDVEMCMLLCSLGVDMKSFDAEDSCKETPLHTAAYWGKLEVVEYLILLKVDIDAITRDGKTALHYAAEASDLAMVKFLCDKGAKSDEIAACGYTPLHAAICGFNFKNCINVCRYLCELEANVNQFSSGMAPIHYAAHSGNLDLCRLLVSFGADINVPSKADAINNFETPLYMASFGQHVEVCKFLIDEGAILEPRTKRYARTNDNDVAKLLRGYI